MKNEFSGLRAVSPEVKPSSIISNLNINFSKNFQKAMEDDVVIYSNKDANNAHNSGTPILKEKESFKISIKSEDFKEQLLST